MNSSQKLHEKLERIKKGDQDWFTDMYYSDLRTCLKVIDKLIEQRNEWIDAHGAYEEIIKQRNDQELLDILEGK